ncbi:hypothetical protein GT348_05135 [Aristophania vespae]|uniref:Glycosyltransferase RgtA/B/C/D-like domain-containing protein n=1 Tax=Aristophania vespae TaxID=2697033 RepID=A0A6P1NJ80_9PROT|nr:glycosyltransferase family 39 protein [Aristophania vespae]QHI95722.1 hypothetical protein GT348_05135 [Aristophania vespae]
MKDFFSTSHLKIILGGGLLCVIALRLVLAAFLPLSPDEAYYWLWSKSPQLSYMDHPPMVALWIKAGTLLFGDRPLAIRFLGPLASFLGTIFLSLTGKKLFPYSQKRALYGAILLNCTLMFGLGMVIMTPDTPLFFFSILTLWAFIQVLDEKRPLPSILWWLCVGLCLGLAFDSKYTACFLGLGMVVYAIMCRPKLFLKIGPWIGVLTCLITISPVIIWNANHHWISFFKQGSRVGDWHPHRALTFISELVAGQIGLATPLIALICVGGFMKSRKEKPALFWLVSPGIIILLFHAFGDRVQANWPAILYPALMLSAGLILWLQRWVISIGVICALTIVIQALFAPLALSAHWDPIARQVRGWEALTEELVSQAHASHSQALYVKDYALASILAYHDKLNFPIISPDKRWHYLGARPKNSYQNVLVVAEKRKALTKVQGVVTRYFNKRELRSYSYESGTMRSGFLVK